MAGNGATPPRLVRVRIRIGTMAIRARFGNERPPVQDGDWDEAAYVDERRRLYAQALEDIGGIGSITVQTDADPTGEDPDGPIASCPYTGDRIVIEAHEAGTLPGAGADGVDGVDEHRVDAERTGKDQASDPGAIAAAAQRVLADRNGWRRHLGAAWFERHRAWRARVGSPIQH